MDIDEYLDESGLYGMSALDDSTVYEILKRASDSAMRVNGVLIPKASLVLKAIISALVKEKRELIKEVTEWELGKKSCCGHEGGFWDVSKRQRVDGDGRPCDCSCSVQSVQTLAASQAPDREDAE